MGVDLNLLPIDCISDDSGFSHEIIQAGRYYDLYDEIREIKNIMEVPKSFSTYVGRHPDWEDVCYGETQEDPYGDKVKYVLAKDLVSAYKRWHKKDKEREGWDKTTFAYLSACKPNRKIALYWH